MSTPYKYWAFISYSSKDRAWAEWLSRSIETYRVPVALRGRPTSRGEPVPARAFPVFRDREELPTSADLGGVINAALEQSRYLVVICSPRSAQSRWVEKEVLEFKALGRENRVLALIIDGEPNASEARAAAECFPAALRFQAGPDGSLTDQRVEPIAADARKSGDGRHKALLKVIAGIIGVDFDLLFQRERRRQRMRRLQLVTLLAACAGGIFSFSHYKDGQRMALARENEQKARVVAAQADAEQGDRSDREGNPNEALAWFAQALREDPANPWAAQRLATLLRDLNHPVPLARFRLPDRNGVEIMAAPDGSGFAVTDDAHGVQCFALPSGQPWFARLVLPGPVRSFAFSGDSSRLAIICEEDHGGPIASGFLWLAILDPHSGVYVKALERTDCQEVTGEGADSTFLTVSGYWVQAWDAATGKLKYGSERKEIVRAATMAEEGRRVFEACADNVARIIDLSTGEITGTLPHLAEVRAISYGAGTKQVATGSEDGIARVWDASTGEALTPPLRHPGPVAFVQLDPGSPRLVTVTRDDLVQLWDTRTGERLAGPKSLGGNWSTAAFNFPGLLIRARGAGVTVLSSVTGEILFTPLRSETDLQAADWSDRSGSGQKILTLANSHEIHLWDVAPRWVKPVEMMHASEVRSFAVSPDGLQLAAGCADGTVQVWNPATGVKLVSLPAQGGAVQRVRFVTDRSNFEDPPPGNLIETDTDRRSDLWSAETGVHFGGGEGTSDRAVAYMDFGETWGRWSADRRFQISARVDNQVYVLDGNRKPVAPAIKLPNVPKDGILSADGSRLLLWSANGMVQIWDVPSASAIGHAMVENAPVTDANFSPDGRYVAVAWENGAVRLWDAATGRALTESLHHPGPVGQLQFTSDSRSLLTRARNGVFKWAVQSVAPVPVPAWIPDLAEAAAGVKVDAAGKIVPLGRDPVEAFAAVRATLSKLPQADGWTQLGRLITGD